MQQGEETNGRRADRRYAAIGQAVVEEFQKTRAARMSGRVGSEMSESRRSALSGEAERVRRFGRSCSAWGSPRWIWLTRP